MSPNNRGSALLETMKHGELSIGVWSVNPSLNELTCNGQPFKVRPRTMELLVFLAERAGHVLSVEELLSGVWPGVVVGHSSVYQAISELRQLFESAGTDDYIRTIPKRGYQLTAQVSPGARPDSVEVAPVWRKPPAIAAVAAGLAIALAAGLYVASFLEADAPTSIAVMAFRDLSPEGNQEYLADGFAEEIIHALHGIEGLRVLGSTSSFQFKDRQESLESIGKQLGVDYILDGSISKDGDKLRIRYNLTEVETGTLLWPESYPIESGDILDVMEEITASVATGVGITLGVNELSQYEGMTRNVDAFMIYMSSGHESIMTAKGQQQIIENLERAVEIDEDFAIAWAELAVMNGLIALGLGPGDTEIAAAKYEYARNRALELLPDSPMILGDQAFRAAAEGRWLEANTLYAKAYGPASGNASRLDSNAYAIFLIDSGRIREAVEYIERARMEHPKDRGLLENLAVAYAMTGDYQKGLEAARRARELQRGPGARRLGIFSVAVLTSHDLELVEQWFGPASTDITEASLDKLNAWARAYMEEPEEAKAILQREAAKLLETSASPTELATWANYYGVPDLALASFRQEQKSAQFFLRWHLWLPVSADMRKLPGFKDLMREFGLAEYWLESGEWPDFCGPLEDGDFICE